MKKMAIVLSVAVASICANAIPRCCPLRHPPRHPNPPPSLHCTYHRGHPNPHVADWIGVGLVGMSAVNTIINPPRQTVVVQQPVIIQPQRTAVWIPESRVVTYDFLGNPIVTIIPGHWEYR